MRSRSLTPWAFCRGLLLTLLTGSVTGCGGGQDDAAAAGGVQTAPTSDTMAATILFDEDVLIRPQTIGTMSDWLLVGDVPRPHALHVIRRSDGRRLASWGREGGGPGEFRHLWGIQPSGDGGAWLYDPSLSRLTLLDVAALVAGRSQPVRRSVNLQSDLNPMTALWISDTLLVSSGMFTRGRLAMFDGSGRLTRTAGPMPPAREGVPPAVAQHAYSGTLVLHPSRPLVAIGTRHADRLEIYQTDGQLVRVARGPRNFEPVYEVQVHGGVPAMASGEDMRFGYIDLAATGDRLYALYSGFTRGERPGRANFGQQVHVFDWDGKLHRVLPLDQPVLGIAVSDDGQNIYAVRHDPEPAVLRYTVPAADQ